MSMELLDEYVSLEKRRRELEAELKAISTRQHAMEEPLAEWMGANGMQHLSKDGLTVYLKTQRWVKKLNEQALADALRESEWSYLVKETINTNSLRSAILEALDNEQDVDQSILANIEITENVTTSVRAS